MEVLKESLRSASVQSAGGPIGRARPLIESPADVFAGDGAIESAFIQGVSLPDYGTGQYERRCLLQDRVSELRLKAR